MRKKSKDQYIISGFSKGRELGCVCVCVCILGLASPTVAQWLSLHEKINNLIVIQLSMRLDFLAGLSVHWNPEEVSSNTVQGIQQDR